MNERVTANAPARGIFVDNRWREAAEGGTIDVLAPATGEVFTRIAAGTSADIDLAVRAARHAFESGPWSRFTAVERGRLLSKMAIVVAERAEELAALEALDTGKPMKQARADIVACARYFEYYGGAADKLHGETLPFLNGHFATSERVPHGVTAAQAAAHIQLVGLVNDVSLRNLIPAELAKGFGFLQSKPRSALSPVFVTPDELGDAWRDNKVHLPLLTHINGQWFGAPEAGEDMQFDFAQLVAHAARTRPLSAGTLVGSGTVANQDTSRGASCFAEKRTVETLEHGKPLTPFMKFGDTVRIEMLDRAGRSIFGAIEQRIERQAAD